MLKSRTLRRSGLSLTELSFGTASIAGLTRAVSDSEAETVMAAAWDAGIRYFDTAPYYGLGLAEQRLGRFLAGRPSDGLVVSTKVGRLLEPLAPGEAIESAFTGALPFKVVYDYTYDGVMKSFDASRERLSGLIPDILYVHDIGRRKHGVENERFFDDLMTGGIPALQELKRKGLIKAYGLGVNETQVCLDAIERSDLDVILLANRYTLMDREGEPHLIARCLERNIDLVIGGVFNSGVLAAPDPQRATFDYRPPAPRTLTLVDELRALCERHGTDIVAASLNFPLRSSAVASVLIGTSRVSSLADCLAKYDRPLPAALWPAVDSIVRAVR